MFYIVTIKFKINAFDTRTDNIKVSGICPIFENKCTDINGSHHSFLVIANSIEEVKEKVSINFKNIRNYGHITRIETVDKVLQ